MPPLPPVATPTVDAIYKQYELKAGDPFRDHLGASLIGTECKRACWYTFRFATKPKFDGRLLRLFQSGFREEARIVDDLRTAGITVYDRDPDNGKQIQYSSFGSHFAGSLDAIAQGFPEAPATWHVLEVKTSNARSFKIMQSKGVKKAKPQHYAQMQMYCHWSNLERAMYIVVNKDTDEIYEERIHYDKAFAEQLEEKANQIIFADEPLERIGEKDSFACKFCNHKSICHEGGWAEANCRTCAFSDVVVDGKWYCAKYKKDVPSLTQRNGCPAHCFIPALVPLEQIDADAINYTVTYEGGLVNGMGHVASKDMGKMMQDGTK